MNVHNPIVQDRKDQKFWDRTLLYSLGIGFVLALVLIATLFVRDNERSDEFNALAQEYSKVRTDKVDLCEEKTNADKPECASDVPPVEEVAPDSTPTVIVQQLPGTVIRQTLPASEIKSAVLLACGGSCKGQDVTAQMVSEAIIAYCAGGNCGQDGTDAPPPSDAQVQAGVSAYCQENDCKGDPGPTCPDGYQGEVLSVMTSLVETEEIFACVATT